MPMKIKIFILFILLALPFASYAEKETDTGKKIADLEKQLSTLSVKEKIDALLQFASHNYDEAPQKCVEYCNQVLELSKQVDYPKAKPKALVILSYALTLLGDRETPLKYLKEALSIYEKLNDRSGVGSTLNSFGFYYTRMDYYNTAMEYFLRSLKMHEETGKKSDLYIPYFSLGQIYIYLEDYRKALEYLHKAMDTLKEVKPETRIAACLLNIGNCYYRLGDFNKALEYFQNALKRFEKNGDNFWISCAKGNIGAVYGNLNNYKLGLKYLFQALKGLEKIGYKELAVTYLSVIGKIYVKMKDFPSALFYYDRAFKIAGELKDEGGLEEIYKSYSNLYEIMEDYKKSLKYYKLYTDTRSSLFNQKKSKQIAELQVKFENEKKVKEIEILKRENKIQAMTRNMFITGFVLIFIILVFLFKRYLYLFSFWKKQKYIGQYRIIESIGSGAMGTVHLAHSIRDKTQLAAVKILKEELVEDESSRQRFKHEGTIIDKLSHPNIVAIRERGEHKGKLYIAMEYLRGKTLAQKIKEDGRLDLKECFGIMIQVTDALAFIHNKDIVHRDLKPANIMLIEKDGKTDFVKLLDFGVALMKFQTRLTQSGMLVGTINYIPPEQITENVYSPAGDVYSLGITFYEMLVGTPAFPADTITAVVEKILDEIPQPPAGLRPEVPEELNRLVMQMLSKNQAQRPLTQDVLNSLTEIWHSTAELI